MNIEQKHIKYTELPNVVIDTKRFIQPRNFLENVEDVMENLNIRDENIGKVISYDITTKKKDINQLLDSLKDSYIDKDLSLLENISIDN